MQRTLQETSFRTIKVIALFCAVTAAVYGALDIEPSSLMVLFFWFGPVFAVILWIQSDAKKNSIGTVLDLGFLIYITWPVTIPWYVFKTRGRAGWRLLLAFFAVIISPHLGWMIGAWGMYGIRFAFAWVIYGIRYAFLWGIYAIRYMSWYFHKLFITFFIALAALTISAHISLAAERVLVPWQPGNAQSFQLGTPGEKRARAKDGSLPVTIYRPAGEGRFAFIVLLHGCGGLAHDAMWTKWVQPWADIFLEQGIGVAVVDSFANRGVDQVCTRDVSAWAVRRADDAYSARAWLAEQSYVEAKRIAVMGMSNGGRTVLAALRASLKHSAPFLAGIALYPGCQSDVASHFYAPLLVLTGKADTVSPARFCEQMKSAQAEADPPLTLIVYPRGPHTFDMRLPDRTVLGMQLGYDADADRDARRRVVEFLREHELTLR